MKSRIVGLLFASSIIAVAACTANVGSDATSDAGSDAPADSAPDAAPDVTSDAGDAGACAPKWSLQYDTAGCTNVRPVCLPINLDACGAQAFCGCDGVTFHAGCGATASQPFAHIGACDDAGDAGPE